MKTSRRAARVSLAYHAETMTKQLSMDALGHDCYDRPEVFDKDVATHVVVKILYGADGVFVFEKATESQTDAVEFQAKLAACVEKLPGISVGGGSEFKRDQNLVESTEDLSCRFYGDFFLKDNPTTFKEAMTVYQSFPG